MHLIGPSPNYIRYTLGSARPIMSTIPYDQMTIPIDKGRCLSIFPSSLDWDEPSPSLEPFNYMAAHLEQILLQHANCRILSILVVSAIYCKEEQDPGHEFILAEVADSASDSELKNYVVLDRNATRLSSSSVSRAQDRFRISFYGNKKSLITQCGLGPYHELEILRFDNPVDQFPLYLLAIIARLTSSSRHMYDLRKNNCYWFASTVWECMLKFPYSSYVKYRNGRGKLYGIRIVPKQSSDSEAIVLKSHDAIPVFLNQMQVNRQVLSTEVEELRREVAKLKAALPARGRYPSSHTYDSSFGSADTTHAST